MGGPVGRGATSVGLPIWEMDGGTEGSGAENETEYGGTVQSGPEQQCGREWATTKFEVGESKNHEKSAQSENGGRIVHPRQFRYRICDSKVPTFACKCGMLQFRISLPSVSLRPRVKPTD